MAFKKFNIKQNKKFFRNIKRYVLNNYFEVCSYCGNIFETEKENIKEPVCKNCFGKRVADCIKCDGEFLIREEDKTWPEYCLNCIYEW